MLNWTQLLLVELLSFQPMLHVGEFLLVGLLMDMKQYSKVMLKIQ